MMPRTVVVWDLGFGLATTEIYMVIVGRDRLVQRGQIGVDQEMVMAGIVPFRAGWCHAQVGEAENHGYRTCDHVAISG